MTVPARNGPAITATAGPRNPGQPPLANRPAAAVPRPQAPRMGAAPPVYRPAATAITALPVYRPNVPLQPKLAGICGPQTCAPGIAQKRNHGDALGSNQPAPPPVYRPQTLPVSASPKLRT